VFRWTGHGEGTRREKQIPQSLVMKELHFYAKAILFRRISQLMFVDQDPKVHYHGAYTVGAQFRRAFPDHAGFLEHPFDLEKVGRVRYSTISTPPLVCSPLVLCADGEVE